MRQVCFTLAILLIAAGSGVAKQPEELVGRIWASGNTAAVEKIERTLGEPLNSLGLEFIETPLNEVSDFLANEYEIEIVLDQVRLDEFGVPPDEMVTINVRNISLAAGLKLMLREMGLTYVVTSDVLLITSPEAADEIKLTAIYPVADLASRLSMQAVGEVVVSSTGDALSHEGGGTIVPIGTKHLAITTDYATHEKIANVLLALRRVDVAVEHARGAADHSHDHDAHDHGDNDGHDHGDHDGHDHGESDTDAPASAADAPPADPFGPSATGDDPFGF